MNRLLTLLTAAGAVVALSTEFCGAVPIDAGLHDGDGLLLNVQLGGGGPVGGGPNGVNNGTGSGVGNGAFRGGSSGPAAGTGTGAVGGGPTGGATAGGLRPNGGNQAPNGSKPAPMQPNGVRKVQ